MSKVLLNYFLFRLIAILLGRLGLTVDQTIEAVIDVGRLPLIETSEEESVKEENSSNLREVLQNLLRRHGFEEDILMFDPTATSQCKTLVPKLY
jgi:hypothetical protein